MSKKVIGIIIIIIGLAAIAGIVYMLFFSGGDSSPASDTGNQPTVNNTATDGNDTSAKNVLSPVKRITANIKNQDNSQSNTSVTPTDPAEVSKDDLKHIAGSFAERFGSYSNQSNFSNIKDLKMFMSERMRSWADAYVIEQSKKNTAKDIYYGIITKSVTEEILEFDDVAGEVTVVVDTRRREALGTSANFSDVFNQSIIIKFVKDGGAWKVDSANWKER